MKILSEWVGSWGWAGSTTTTRQVTLQQNALLSLIVFGILSFGFYITSVVRIPQFRETIVAIPVALGTLVLLRYLPTARQCKLQWPVRVVFLALPFVLLTFADLSFDPALLNKPVLLAVVVLQCISIGVKEELIFRYCLHRLWSQYGAWFYVTASALFFYLAHVPAYGALSQVSIISGIIGVIFGLSRIAGMPIVLLIILHAVFDFPSIVHFLQNFY